MDYKEKLKLAKEALDSGSYDKDTIEYIFPELKDSGNEKKQEDYDFIDIPFGAFDSELYHQEIYIPDGFEATIKDNKVILKRKENEDNKIRKAIHIYLDWLDGRKDYAPKGEYSIKDMIAWLEKQGEQKFAAKNIVEIWKDMRFEVYAQADGNRHEPNYSDDSTKMFSLNDIDEIIEKMSEQIPQGKSALEAIKEEKADNANKIEPKDYRNIDPHFFKTVNKAKPFDKYEGLTDFERTLADICIGWIGEEIGWKQYIKDNADILLKIAIEKFNSIQDAPFEQNFLK